MATRVFKNRRKPQTFTPPTEAKAEPPKPAPAPLIDDEDLPPPPKSSKQVDPEKPRQCKCGCGKSVRGLYARGHSGRGKTYGEGGGGRPKDSGFGLWVCGNCCWYRKPCPRSRKVEVGCKDDDIVVAASKPCALNPTWHGGYFEAVKSPERSTAVDLSDWTSDELAFLQHKARLRLVEIQQAQIQGLHIAQRVRYLINGQLHRGEIIRLTQRHAVINDDEDFEVRVRGEDVHPDEDIPASGQ
jgi:hypothetical protein